MSYLFRSFAPAKSRLVSSMNTDAVVNLFSKLKAHNSIHYQKLVFAIFTICISLFSSASYALYQYTYSGSTINGTLTNYHVFEPEPYTTTEDFSGAIFIQFTSPTLLTGATDLTNIGSFMMGGETTPSYYGNGTITGNWVYPYPYQVSAYHSYGEFQIAAADANGLPTDWNIKMQGDEGYTRHTYSNFESTPSTDKIFGYSEYGYEWSGQTTNQGQWSVVSVVPEPETYAMLLAGLGLMAYVIRRRKLG